MQGMPSFGRALGLAHRLVDRQPLDAGHRGDRHARVRAVDDEQRPDQVVGGEHVLAHHAARPVGAAVAARAGGQVERRRRRAPGASTGTTRTRDSIGRPYLMAMRGILALCLAGRRPASVMAVRPVDVEDRRSLSVASHGFRTHRGPARLPGHRAAIRARRDDAARARLGRERDLPGRDAAQGGGARLRRHLCEGRRRRLGAVAARRHDHLRGAGAGLHLDRGLHLDPQHGGLDDRRLRRRGAAPALPAEALHAWSISRAIA